jgi:histidyl-tRNA synthetase
MKQKMKYADRLGIPYAAIIGETEVQNGVISLKNMREKGAQQTLTPEEAINILK